MKELQKKNVETAAAEFEFCFPALAKQLRHLASDSRYKAYFEHDLLEIIKELIKQDKRARGRPCKKIANLDDDHSQLAYTIDRVLVPAHEKSGAKDPLDAAIREVQQLELAEGKQKDIATIRKYYWMGRKVNMQLGLYDEEGRLKEI